MIDLQNYMGIVTVATIILVALLTIGLTWH